MIPLAQVADPVAVADGGRGGRRSRLSAAVIAASITFCGDDFVDDDIDLQTGKPVESCDDGKDNVGYRAQQGGCGYDCQLAPWCGDGIRNGPEQCDLGEGKNTGEYGGCNAACTFAPRCGDRLTQGSEQCDEGLAGSLRCTPGCKLRSQVE